MIDSEFFFHPSVLIFFLRCVHSVVIRLFVAIQHIFKFIIEQKAKGVCFQIQLFCDR